MRDAMDLNMHDLNENDELRADDQVGTVEVQILLSWFFETSAPGEIPMDISRAA